MHEEEKVKLESSPRKDLTENLRKSSEVSKKASSKKSNLSQARSIADSKTSKGRKMA